MSYWRDSLNRVVAIFAVGENFSFRRFARLKLGAASEGKRSEAGYRRYKSMLELPASAFWESRMACIKARIARA